MKAIITQALSVAVLFTLVIGGWYVFIKPVPEPTRSPFEVFAEKDEPLPVEEAAKPEPPSDASQPEVPPQPKEPEELSEPVNVPGNYEYFDEEGISAEAAEEFRKISVLPFNPKIIECKDAWTTKGGQSELLFRKVCTGKYKHPKHPYFEYDAATLLDLADNNDPLAAAVLAERLTLSHPTEAIALRISSAIQSGKPAPLMQVAEQHYPIEGVLPHVRERNLLSHYAHVSAAKRMGHPSADLSFIEGAGSERVSAYQNFADKFFENIQQPHGEDATILTIGMRASILGESLSNNEN